MLRKTFKLCCTTENSESSYSSSSESESSDETKTTKHQHGLDLGELAFENNKTQLYLSTYKEMPCAIKLIHQKSLYENEVRILKYLKEHQLPNTIGFLNKGKLSIGRYIILEKAKCDAYEFIHNHHLNWTSKLKIMQQTTLGLYHMHKHSLLHRDIKIENILVTESNKIKLCDFGASCFTWELPERGNPLVGTYIMLAPETLEKKQYSKKSDVYSLGLTFWEIAAEKDAFNSLKSQSSSGGIPFSPLQQLTILSKKRCGTPEKISDDWPQKTRHIIKNCWLVNPIMRPETRELLTLIRQNIESLQQPPKRKRIQRSSTEPSYKRLKKG